MYTDFSDPDFLPIRIRAQEKRPIQTKEPASETLIFSLTVHLLSLMLFHKAKTGVGS